MVLKFLRGFKGGFKGTVGPSTNWMKAAAPNKA